MVLRHIDRELRADFGVSNDDISILASVLTAAPSGARMGDLAHQLATEPRHITYRVGRLERRDIVERRVDPSDKRVLRVHTTDETATFFRLCQHRLDELVALYLTDLVPHGQRTALTSLLVGVVEGYRHHFAIPASDQPSVHQTSTEGST